MGDQSNRAQADPNTVFILVHQNDKMLNVIELKLDLLYFVTLSPCFICLEV